MEEKIKIKISISETFLKDIEQNIKGETRNDKLINCVELGIQALIERKKLDPSAKLQDLVVTTAFSEEIGESE